MAGTVRPESSGDLDTIGACHARYSGDEATIVIASGEVLDGSFPSRSLRPVREWLSEHREELAENFQLAIDMQPVRPVAPLP